MKCQLNAVVVTGSFRFSGAYLLDHMIYLYMYIRMIRIGDLLDFLVVGVHDVHDKQLVSAVC